MMRLTVPWAPVVCSVAKTTWPVSAAVIAASIVSRSRISPTRITSGSCRKAAADGLGETRHVHAQFPLVDRRLLVRVVELDRVFDRDDMVVEVLVDVVDHRRQRGGLAGARRPRDQDQSRGAACTIGQHRRRAQVLEVHQLHGNLPQHHAPRSRAA